MPQEQMPESLWIKVQEGHHQRYISVYSVPATEHTEYIPASRLRALAERVETMQKMLLAWCAGDSHWGDMTLRDASLATLAEQGIELPRISSFLHDGTKGEGK